MKPKAPPALWSLRQSSGGMRPLRRTLRRRRQLFVWAGVVLMGLSGGIWWLRSGSPQPAFAGDSSSGAAPALAVRPPGAPGRRDWTGGLNKPTSGGAVVPAAAVSVAPKTPDSHSMTEKSNQPPVVTKKLAEETATNPNPPLPPSTKRDDAPAAPPQAAAPPPAAPTPTPVPSGSADIDAARRLYDAGKLIEARQSLNTLLSRSQKPAEQAGARELLAKISAETLFNPKYTGNDPLVDIYTVQSGDRLINVCRQYDVPHEIVLKINGIADAGKLNVGRKLRIPKGPFHARIYESQFRMDLYLQDTYVRSYPVGLGKDQGTPLGQWRVSKRQTNPTWYPPPSAPDKRVIAGGDPKNPLGTHWIALEGIEGNALGKPGFGIHGTIEPQSIGKAESLGCIRLLNEDVAFVYTLLMPGKSTVATLP